MGYGPGIEVIYEAPDRVEQIEHGESSSVRASTNGPPSSSGTVSQTITKVFISDRVYEATAPTGQSEPFSVSARCPGEENVAEFVLSVLRAIAVSQRISPVSGGGFAFTIPKGGGIPFPVTGVVTIASGLVTTISANRGGGIPAPFVIGSIDSAPPVTAPVSASASEVSCGSSGAGSATSSGGSSSTAP